MKFRTSPVVIAPGLGCPFSFAKYLIFIFIVFKLLDSYWQFLGENSKFTIYYCSSGDIQSIRHD